MAIFVCYREQTKRLFKISVTYNTVSYPAVTWPSVTRYSKAWPSETWPKIPIKSFYTAANEQSYSLQSSRESRAQSHKCKTAWLTCSWLYWWQAWLPWPWVPDRTRPGREMSTWHYWHWSYWKPGSCNNPASVRWCFLHLLVSSYSPDCRKTTFLGILRHCPRLGTRRFESWMRKKEHSEDNQTQQ